MKIQRQGRNPYLPDYEYIPDGEPHVFGGRVYVYGSHDRFGGKKFCLNDYVCYSAPVDDLTDWRYEGVIYTKTQDPRMKDGKHELWAPDVVHGKDGRYYLYYCPDDRFRAIGVAVCGSPAGKYEFLGIVQDPDGGWIGEREGDTIQFDPGVFIDDDGTVYLFSGNGPISTRSIGREPKASVVMTLEDDMITIRTEPQKLLPVLGEAEGTGFEGHEFFEASSIRKREGKYYLIYSSVHLHELCYAVSDRPDRGYRFGGVIVSNCDLLDGASEKKNCFGNNHGGIEKIGSDWYVFYHRPTNRSMFSRQGCAEKIIFREDGSIPPVKMTSEGLNGRPLRAKGIYPASMVCNLYGKYPAVVSLARYMGKRHPYLTQDGPDTDPDTPGIKPVQYIKNGKNGMTAVFRYFESDKAEAKRIGIKIRGTARGCILVYTAEKGEAVGRIPVCPSKKWRIFSSDMVLPKGIHEIRFVFEGRGTLDFLKFGFGRSREVQP